MAYRPRLKICGVANAGDARLVSTAGVDYCGILVNVGFSERSLPLGEAREVAATCTVPVVILLCDPSEEAAVEAAREIQPRAIQLLCRESPGLVRALRARVNCEIWKTLHLPAVQGQATPEEYADAGVDAFLLDSAGTADGFLRMGGTGTVVDWALAAEMIPRLPRPVFLAGGIGPDNVARAIERVRPFGVDLCSGVERSKGRKDPEKVRRLVEEFTRAVAGIEEAEK